MSEKKNADTLLEVVSAVSKSLIDLNQYAMTAAGTIMLNSDKPSEDDIEIYKLLRSLGLFAGNFKSSVEDCVSKNKDEQSIPFPF